MGDIDALLINAPPRHGKSMLTTQYLPAWYIGLNPDNEVMLACHTGSFAREWGGKVRDVIERQGGTFGIGLSDKSAAADRWAVRNHSGAMRTYGVDGNATGQGADLLICDDIVKNPEEAQSETFRRKAWDWFQTVAATRLSPTGKIIMMQTRWHMDDPAGKFLAIGKELWGDRFRHVNLPAFANDGDELGRQPGEALWPQRWPVKRLMIQKRLMSERWWAANYQQTPIPGDSTMFKRETFKIVQAAPVCAKQVRYWDMAATVPKNGSDPDWTVGTRMGKTDAGEFPVIDVRRVRATPLVVENLIVQTAQLDGRGVEIWMEQEPGSAGVAMIAHYARLLAGFTFRADKVTGNKQMRADPLSAQSEAGNVLLVAGPWNSAWLDEFEVFPYGKHDDHVDSASGAFDKLTSGGPFFFATANDSMLAENVLDHSFDENEWMRNR